MEPTLTPIPADAHEPATNGALYELKEWLSRALGVGVTVDRDKLRHAILSRRESSQRDNAEWEAFDDSPTA